MLTPAAGRAHPPRVASTCSVAPRLLAALAAGLAISLGATAQNPTLEVGGPFARELPANSPILHEGRDGDRLVTLRGIQFDFTPTASGNYTILVKSHFFDVGAMVALGEKDVASDDNGWLNTHSRVVARLTAGERYAIHVMTYENGGAFEITVRRGKVGAIADEVAKKGVTVGAQAPCLIEAGFEGLAVGVYVGDQCQLHLRSTPVRRTHPAGRVKAAMLSWRAWLT